MKRILLFLIAIFFITDAGSTGIGANDTTANCDNNTLGQTSGTANIEVDWQPNTINIRWYDGNTQLNVQSSAQSCVYDDDLYLPATQPTKTGYTFKGWKVRIPGIYTELEYLRSDRRAYINTMYSPTSATRAEVVVKVDSGTYNWNIFGSGTKDSDYSTHYPVLTVNTMNDYSYEIKFSEHYSWDVVPSNSLEKNVVSISATEFMVNGVVLRTTTNTVPDADNKPFYLFARWRPEFEHANETIQVYRFSIYENNMLVLNFIPVKRNSDNVLGMYDTVSGNFFTNAGSGSFIAGPVVQ